MPVGLKLKDLRVTSLDVDFHEVTWKIRESAAHEDVLDYSFHVLRSEAEEGPYDVLAGPFVDRYSFIDNVLQVQHRWRRYWYKLRVTERLSGDYEETEPFSNEPEPDLIAAELRRHLRLVFAEFAGRRCIVLPARTFGQRCECWNEMLEKRTRSGCETCYDTGFTRGYMHPVEAWIQADPSPKTKQVMNAGTTQQSNTTMRLGYYPRVKPDDLIVEPENRRWKVISQSQTEHSRTPVHQELSVHEVEPGDIEFRIPVRFEDALPNVYFTPARNFTNPQNLQNFLDGQLPDIFNLYRKE